MRSEVRKSVKPPRSILGYGVREIKGNPKTVYVLDTNVLVNDVNAIDKLLDGNTNAVVVPWIVLSELDALKMTQDLSRQINEVVRIINKKLHKKEGNFYIAQGDTKYFIDLDKENPDHHVIAVCLSIKNQHPELPIVLVSNDSMVHVVGLRLGIKVEEYKADQVNRIDFEKSLPEFVDSRFEMDDNSFLIDDEASKLVEVNGGAIIHSSNGFSRFAVVRKSDNFIPIRADINALGISPFSINGDRNWAQYVALQQLLDPEVKLMTIHGEAGTGKTLLAIASAISQLNYQESSSVARAGSSDLAECLCQSGHGGYRKRYHRIFIARPFIHLSNKDSMGFLPGDVNTKSAPWLAPIHDNIDFISSLTPSNNTLIEKINGLIEILPLSFIRGRTLAGAFVIIDEAQNLTRAEIKTIVTRAGDNTKVVLVGDINQIDIRWLDKLSSGLTHVSVKMNGLSYFANVFLDQSVRSEMARDAARLL